MTMYTAFIQHTEYVEVIDVIHIESYSVEAVKEKIESEGDEFVILWICEGKINPVYFAKI